MKTNYRSFSPLVVYASIEPPMWAVCVRDNPSKHPKALLSMVGTDEGRGWVGKTYRGFDFKNAGYGSFNRNPPYMGFPAATNLISAPLDRAAPFAALVLLVVDFELHPLGWVCSTS